jgi:antitoxin YefM
MSALISYTDAQVNLDQLCDQVVETGEAVIIIRPDGKNVALVAESELSGLIETLYLLRSPANAARLTTALERSRTDVIQPQSLDALCAQFGLTEIDAEDDRLSA